MRQLYITQASGGAMSSAFDTTELWIDSTLYCCRIRPMYSRAHKNRLKKIREAILQAREALVTNDPVLALEYLTAVKFTAQQLGVPARPSFKSLCGFIEREVDKLPKELE